MNSVKTGIIVSFLCVSLVTWSHDPKEQSALNMRLIDAVCYTNVNEVKKLVAEGANVNAVMDYVPISIRGLFNANRWTPLMHAAAPLRHSAPGANAQIATALIANGASVNQLDYYGRNALAIANEKNDKAMVELLINAGANVNIVYNEKPNLLEANAKCTPLIQAIRNGNRYLVNLLLNKGARIDIYVHGWLVGDHSALYAADVKNDPEIIKMLEAHCSTWQSLKWKMGRLRKRVWEFSSY